MAKVWTRCSQETGRTEPGPSAHIIMHESLPGKWIVVVMEKIIYSMTVNKPNDAIKKYLCDALQKLHSLGFVHGDLHPQNILVLPLELWTLTGVALLERQGTLLTST